MYSASICAGGNPHMFANGLNPGGNRALGQLHISDILLRYADIAANNGLPRFHPSCFIDDAELQESRHGVDQPRAADANGLLAAKSRTCKCTICEPYAVDRAGTLPTPCLIFTPFKRRTGGCGTAIQLAFVPERDFAVGAKVHEHGRRLPFVQSGSQHPAYDIRANERADTRGQVYFRVRRR